MVNTSKLFAMVQKWKRMTILGRKRISLDTKNSNTEAATFSTTIADKGHFYVYSSDGKRFMVPLTFLSNSIFEELLKVCEEEFGLPRDGPITLPCDAAFLEFLLSMLRGRISKNVDNEFLMSGFRRNCSRSLILRVETCQQLEVF